MIFGNARKQSKKSKKNAQPTSNHDVLVPSKSTNTMLSMVENNTAQPDDILQLQRLYGNKYVTNLVQQTRNSMTLQRMPTATEVITKSSFKGKKKNFGAKYQLIVDGVRALDTIYDRVSGGSMATVTTGFQAILGQLSTIEGYINSYLAGQQTKGLLTHKSATRDNYANNLLSEIVKERTLIAEVTIKINSDDVKQLLPMWSKQSLRSLLNTISNLTGAGREAKTVATTDAERDDDGEIKTMGGGINEVVDFGDSVFKENQNSILSQDDIANLNESDSKSDNKKGGQQGTLSYAARLAGITNKEEAKKGTSDARLSNRDIATSRLDELLGGGIIARTQKAFYETGQGKQEGTLMEKAKGRQGGDVMEAGNFTADATQQDAKNIYINDPELQRQLSRLQLLDALAYQVDRHGNNYFIQTDKTTGKVTGITAIDNDMSFGEHRDDPNSAVKEYPGLSKFVDKALAENILQLDPNVLRLAMADLLSDGEINALITRFTKLKVHLQDLKDKNQLLAPDQWDDLTAKGLLDEDVSYFASIAKFVK